MYDSLDELTISKPQKGLKRSKSQLLNQFDHLYEFFYKGQQLSAKDVKNLIDSHPQSQSMIIVNTKSLDTQIKQRPSYESHRETIEKYIDETKINNKQKIRQNAEFIFQNAIDGNFKYHTFEYFELEKQFTEERKAELMDKVFLKFCESQDHQISLAERKKKGLQNDKNNNQQKASIISDRNSPNDSVNQQGQQKVQSSKTQQKSHINSQQNVPQQSSRQILQLHELEYINQNWKELLCINKDLLKTNLDNLKYYEQLKEKRDFPQVEGMDGKMEIQNRSQKDVNKANSDQDVEI